MPNPSAAPGRTAPIVYTICPLILVLCVTAQAAQPDRIVEPIDSAQTVVLKGNVHPKALPQYDQGPVDPSMRLGRVTLQLSPSPRQQAALEKLLAEQQDAASPNYHRWLTPEQFANGFGVSRGDTLKLTNWLRSEGFTVVQVARARNWIAFSGTAVQVQQALHTEIRNYVVDGEQHYANSTDVYLPKALAGVVSSVHGLNDFVWKSMLARRAVPQTTESADWSAFYSTGGQNFLAPDDIATIYDIKPLYAAGIDGSNMNLVIVGQTDITLSDITQFRSGFNLPTIKLQQTLATGCVDPGTTGDLAEADLDLEWSSAVARNANINFVKCDIKDGGVFSSVQYAVDSNLAPVISMSYGGCEPENGLKLANEIRSVIQQANSSGITFLSSAGDSGAAGCDSGSPPATKGLEVNLPASVPETTALGGSEFNEGSGTYWGSNGPNLGSALSYIPEEGWNDTALGAGFAAGGGGKSIYFSKPAWQSGSDGVRDVPDVTITASPDHDGYLLCSGASCANGITKDNFIVGGTSASTPVFAGIVVLLNQYLVKNGLITGPGLSNINPTLYHLAISYPSAFHDITTGNNMVKCTPGTPANYPPAQQCPTGGQFGYTASAGYDLVTGLGSVDAYNLISGWSSAVPSSTTLGVSPASPVNFGTSVTLTATVTASSHSSETPTGSVSFSDPVKGKLGSATLNGSGVATFVTSTLAGASYSITAKYSGDTNFASSTSSAVPYSVRYFNISANPTTVSVSAPGRSGGTTLTVTPLGGFNQPVSYSCTGLPAGATCTFAAASSTSETLTIATSGPSASLNEMRLRPSRGLFYALILPGLFGLALLAENRKSRRMMRIVTLVALLSFAGLCMPACGGGGSTAQSNPGTPVGSSTVTITATAGSLTAPPTLITLSVQ